MRRGRGRGVERMAAAAAATTSRGRPRGAIQPTATEGAVVAQRRRSWLYVCAYVLKKAKPIAAARTNSTIDSEGIGG